MNTSQRDRNSAPRSDGFTVIELLALMVVVAFGALMLAPAFARTRSNSPSIQCLNNLSQLQRAFAMYAADSSGTLALNSGGFSGNINNWAGNVLDWNTGTAAMSGHPGPNTNTWYLLAAALGPYTKNAALYKCPADRVPSAIGQRCRSYSMNGFLGGTTMWVYYGLTSYRIYLKESDLTKPSPAMTWVFLDEHPDSINDWLYATHMPPTALWPQAATWDDVPASHHNSAGALSFADGHAELHKWVDPNTRAPVLRISPPSSTGLTSVHDSSWLVARSSAPK